MTDGKSVSRRAYVAETLAGYRPKVSETLAHAIIAKHPGSAVLLYGSGISVLQESNPADVLYDFYVIVPSYRAAYKSFFFKAFNRTIPPNVFYIEEKSEYGLLRAKYAVLSIEHFEKLVSNKTFHSYFWARFAQPSRFIAGPDELRERITDCVVTSVDSFVANAASLLDDDASVTDIWQAGLSSSYKAELRAEAPDRVEKLLKAYGDWPAEVTNLDIEKYKSAPLSWRLRVVQGGFLSVFRLVKGLMTFEGGMDYIAWKISRHAGFNLPVKEWERRWPVMGVPSLARRYYKLKRAHNRP